MNEFKEQSARALVAQIEAGDTNAERYLVERYTRPLRLIILQQAGDPTLADDIVQDTFVIAFRKLRNGELRNPDALSGFLRQTAINRLIEGQRKKARYVRQDDGMISLLTPHRDNKAERLDRQSARDLLDDALDKLAQPRDREILQRFYLLDEDKLQICSALSLSPAHFDRVLYRAKQRMRKLLHNNGELRMLLLGGLAGG